MDPLDPVTTHKPMKAKPNMQHVVDKIRLVNVGFMLLCVLWPTGDTYDSGE